MRTLNRPVSRNSLLVALAVVVLSLAGPVRSAMAKAGDLDPTFGTGGIVTNSIVHHEEVNAMVRQPDGKLVVAGVTGLNPNESAFVARYLPNGGLDLNFGTNGVATVLLGSGTGVINDVALQPDGGIVVIGRRTASANATWFIARFLQEGVIDTGFHTPSGTLSFDVGPTGTDVGRPFSVFVQPTTGRIIAGGGYYNSSLNRDFDVAAIAPDGTTAVTDFGSGANAVTQISATHDDYIRSLLPLPDGNILAVGSLTGTPNQIAIARYTASGAPDASFGTGGSIIENLPIRFDTTSAVLLPDGKFVVAGQTYNPTQQIALVRLLPDGSLDSSFGSGGITTFSGGGTFTVARIALAPDGKLVTVGRIADTDSGPADFSAVRFNTNGTPDSGFGTGAIARIPVSSGDDIGAAIVVQPDGKIVLGGTAVPDATSSIQLVRLEGTTPSAVAPPPFSKITSPSKSKLASKKFKVIAGTAGPAGAVAKVEVAVRLVDAKKLKKKKCVWLKNTSAKLKTNKADKKKKCTTPVWLKASGKESWSLKLKKKLAKGKYEISVRATLSDGQKQTAFTSAAGNFRKLKVT